MVQEKAWGSANGTQRSHSNRTSSEASNRPTASGAPQRFSKGRELTEGRAEAGDLRLLGYQPNKAGFAVVVSQERGAIQCSVFGAGNQGVLQTTLGTNF